jgi:hypothetical protein
MYRCLIRRMVQVFNVGCQQPDQLNCAMLCQVLFHESIKHLLHSIAILLSNFEEQYQSMQLCGWLSGIESFSDFLSPLPNHLLVLREQLDTAKKSCCRHSWIVASNQREYVPTLSDANTFRFGQGSTGQAPAGSFAVHSS